MADTLGAPDSVTDALPDADKLPTDALADPELLNELLSDTVADKLNEL